MSTIEIISKIEALKEWEALAEEAAAEIESLRDAPSRRRWTVEASRSSRQDSTSPGLPRCRAAGSTLSGSKMSWARTFTSGSARKRSAAALPLAAKERAHT